MNTSINIFSWNVNSVRNVIKKNNRMSIFLDKHNPDILCLQETKLFELTNTINKELEILSDQYKYIYHNFCKIRKGYSGTSIYSKIEPINVIYGVDSNDFIDKEGRVTTLEFESYYLINVYTPNSGRKLERLDYRTEEWDKYFWDFIERLQTIKPVIVCGDLNVVVSDLDIHNPKNKSKMAGCTKKEKESFNNYIKKTQLIDIARCKYGDFESKYTFWSSFGDNRAKNKGWRLDYFYVSPNLKKKVIESNILDDIYGSDHCPISVTMDSI